jgi:putative hemolysin
MMKVHVFALAAACALTLAACDSSSPPAQPDPNDPVKVDDECPRDDGEYCR